MDVISGVASVFAVVSLAIQLAQSTQDVTRFLRNNAGASKELDRLLDILEQLKVILEDVQALNTDQIKHSGDPDLRLAAVFTALQTCQNSFKSLESVLNKAKIPMKKSNTLSKTWASFKFTLKKNEVEDFQNQLQQAMNMIHLAMTTKVLRML